MRKILLALNAHKIDPQTIDFANYIALSSKSNLTGVFLEDFLTEEIKELSAHNSYAKEYNDIGESKKKTEEHIHLFHEACQSRGVHNNIHRKRGYPSEEMIEESRFADVIVLNPETTFKKKIESVPSSFAKDLLEGAECPILLTPVDFEGVDKIVFSYNGSSSSMFAIKQFTYIFPEFHNKKILIVEVNKSKDSSIQNKHQLTEWLKNFYADVEFNVLNGDSSEELFKFLFDKKNLILVMGAYGRGLLSSLFKPSRANLLVKSANFPIFITHL